MAKSNFLLVDLNETKTKKLAETITSDTSRKILNHLAETEQDTELNISKTLELPISTVHYHLQKLREAKLIEVEEFHYSVKGREINHYKLANKYIIIAPKKVSGLREKLKGLLPVAGAMAGISIIIKLIQSSKLSGEINALGIDAHQASSAAARTVADRVIEQSAPLAAESIQIVSPVVSQPDLALWFLLGSITTIILYILIDLIRGKISRKI